MWTSNTSCFKRNNSNLKDPDNFTVWIKHIVPKTILSPYQTSLLNYRHILKSMWSDSSVKKTVEWTRRRVVSRPLWLDARTHTVMRHALIIHDVTSHQEPIRTRHLHKQKEILRRGNTWSQLKAEELTLSTDVLTRRYKYNSYTFTHTPYSHAKRHVHKYTNVSEGMFKHNHITTSTHVITIHHLFVNIKYEWCRQVILCVCSCECVYMCVYNVCMCVMRLDSSRTFIYSVAGEEIEWGWVIWWHFHKGLHYSLSHSLSLIQYSFALPNPHIW